MPVWVLDLGPGMPARSSFRSEGSASGPRPTLKGRSTLRSMFASVTRSVQWEDTQYHWGRPGARRVPKDSQIAWPPSLTALGLFLHRLHRNHLVGARGREPASARYSARATRDPPHPRTRAPIGPSRRHSVWEAVVIDPDPGARLGGGRGPNQV